MLFPYYLKRLVRTGTLRLVKVDGTSTLQGSGPPHVTIRLHRKSLEWSLGWMPELKIAEAYMDGVLTLEEGSLRDFLWLLLENFKAVERQPFFQMLARLNGRAALLQQFNPIDRARKNVVYHYDLPDKLYDLFLDTDRQYSCAYFTDLRNSLEQAQFDKKNHIASKLLLNKPGLKILDIGCGWGGLALFLAKKAAGEVKGITLSLQQFKAAKQRAKAENAEKSCHFELRDYRLESGPYDRIVSVGMFEHVGRKNYDEFFTRIRDLLADDGVCLLHTIARFQEPEQTNSFIRKHIFPGADIPSLSEIIRSVQRSALFTTDVEILRLHYAETLKRWEERFRTHYHEVADLMGDRFCRKWELYLTGCEMSFRCGYLMVAQIQLSKKLDAVPLVRDYMYEQEHYQPMTKPWPLHHSKMMGNV